MKKRYNKGIVLNNDIISIIIMELIDNEHMNDVVQMILVSKHFSVLFISVLGRVNTIVISDIHLFVLKYCINLTNLSIIMDENCDVVSISELISLNKLEILYVDIPIESKCLPTNIRILNCEVKGSLEHLSKLEYVHEYECSLEHLTTLKTIDIVDEDIPNYAVEDIRLHYIPTNILYLLTSNLFSSLKRLSLHSPNADFNVPLITTLEYLYLNKFHSSLPNFPILNVLEIKDSIISVDKLNIRQLEIENGSITYNSLQNVRKLCLNKRFSLRGPNFISEIESLTLTNLNYHTVNIKNIKHTISGYTVAFGNLDIVNPKNIKHITIIECNVVLDNLSTLHSLNIYDSHIKSINILSLSYLKVSHSVVDLSCMKKFDRFISTASIVLINECPDVYGAEIYYSLVKTKYMEFPYDDQQCVKNLLNEIEEKKHLKVYDFNQTS